MLPTNERTQKKKLYIRLSSLGDVVLAMSALSATSSTGVDWLVASEFSALLEHHPRIGKVWVFDRKEGFQGWKRLARQIWEEGYDEVYDLHRTLRTKILKLFFLYWSVTEGSRSNGSRRREMPLWKVISKQRLRLYGYFLLKSLWPKVMRPEPVAMRSARLVGGSGHEKPDARHLLQSSRSGASDTASVEENRSIRFQALLSQLDGKSYICVMPGSKWPGKKWPVEFFAELLTKLSSLSAMPGLIPVIMGTSADSESVRLVEFLAQKKVPAVSAVGAWNLREVSQILSGAWRYLGNDTGLGHLAEAVGVPSYVIFGPTHEDMGFGPWRPESRAIGRSLACRPCGKDGRYCYRVNDRFACMKGLRAEDVLAELKT